MLGDPARCATHKTVLTSGGTCLLCMRRIDDAGGGDPRRKVLPWTTAAVVGGLVVLAVVFKIYLGVSDRHPAQAATAEPSGTSGTSVAAPLPTSISNGTDRANLLAGARRDVVIDLYGAAWCPHCVRARGYLEREGIAYAYHDVDQPSNKTTMRKVNPRGGIPTIKIDNEVVVGFSEGSVKRAMEKAAEARVAHR